MDGFAGLAIGVCAGLLLGWYTAYQSRVDTCEAELPRNEICILIAVPKKGE